MSKVVNNYQLCTLLGKGSYAKVYKAVKLDTGEDYAVKAIDMEKIGVDETLRRNLSHEIAIMRGCCHENLCRLVEHFQGSKHIYLVLEYCAGGDLQKFIRKSGRLPEFHVVRTFMKQLSSGLNFLHSRQIIHRDIKSQNILLSEDSPSARLKIADFGFAKHLEVADMATSVCGTPLYMAPEVFERRKYDAKADLWSIGCVLYEMLVGSTPFTGKSHAELFENVRERGLSIPESVDVSEDLLRLLQRLLVRDPLRRASLEDFCSACDVLSQNIDASTPPASINLAYTGINSSDNTIVKEVTPPREHAFSAGESDLDYGSGVKSSICKGNLPSTQPSCQPASVNQISNTISSPPSSSSANMSSATATMVILKYSLKIA